jgi:monofunctional biosynthetic peptidoglycan transglycosylase
MRRRNGKRPLAGRLLRFAAALVVAVLAATWVPIWVLRFVEPPTTAFMLRDPSPALRQEWMPWAELGTTAPLAVMAAEDQKFPSHFGFDLESIHDAIAAGGRLRGASTITQQTAKNLFLWPERSFVRKGLEAYLTTLIELSWPKQRTLEIYLNVAEFGPGIYGVGAASRAYFGNPPSALDDDEAALLAAVLPNPKQLHVDRPSSYVRERQRWIREQMGRLRRDGALALVAG